MQTRRRSGGGQEPGQSLSPRKNIYVFATGRDYALMSTSIRDNAAVFTWDASTPRSAESLVKYLGNERLFPHHRPRVVTFFGDFPRVDRDRIAAGLRPRGFAIEVEPDTLVAAAARGSARVVWYSDPQFRPLAQFWAHRAETVHGTRYLVLGSALEYERLESLGAIVPDVIDFGGSFPIAASRPGWVVRGPGFERGADAPRPVGMVRSLPTIDDMQREVVALHRLYRTVKDAEQGTDNCPSWPCGPPNHPPADPSKVDVVFYTGYFSDSNPTDQPLDFYDSGTSGVANCYTDSLCGADYCRKNAVMVQLPFKDDLPFGYFKGDLLGNCDQSAYNASTIGYPCDHDFRSGTDINYLDAAVKAETVRQLGILKGSPYNYQIRTVVFVAHWLDIPYREHMFPYNPGYLLDQAFYYPAGPPVVTDADFQSMDTDNDVCTAPSGCPPNQCAAQNYGMSPVDTGNCSVNGWDPFTPPTNPDAKDPDLTDQHYDGDLGSLDFLLADWGKRNPSDPYDYARASFGRICGHTPAQAMALVQTANAVLNGAAPPAGATAVYGNPTGTLLGQKYDTFNTLMDCRYGVGSASIWTPCSEMAGADRIWCANEPAPPSPNVPYSPSAHFYPKVSVGGGSGEIVVAIGHNLHEFYTDSQEVEFFNIIGNPHPPNPPIVESRDIYQWGSGFEPGVWMVEASNAMPYAFLNPAPWGNCDSGLECWHMPPKGTCTGTAAKDACMLKYNTVGERSFVGELIDNGVLAIRGVIGGHSAAPGYNYMVDDNTGSFLRELIAPKMIGEAHRISVNEPLYVWKQLQDGQLPEPTYEEKLALFGDPLVTLPVRGTACTSKPAFAAGKGEGLYNTADGGNGLPDESGTPHVRAVRRDGILLTNVVDFYTDNPPATPSWDVTHGNTLDAGNLDNALGDQTDEFASGRGPQFVLGDGGADSTVKVFDHKGVMQQDFFFAFPGQTDYGVNVAVGKVRNTTGREEIVAGKGPGTGSAFAPEFRVFEWDGSYWIAVLSQNAYSGLEYGVNVTTGDFDGDGLDEVGTGKGRGPTYDSRIKGYNADTGGAASLMPGGTYVPYSGITYGATVGSAKLVQGSIRSQLLVGRGPGTQAGCTLPCTPPATDMDDDIKVLDHNGSAWVDKLTIQDPYPLTFASYGHVAGAFAGASAAGIDVDGLLPVKDEIAVIRGPVSHDATSPVNTTLPNFKGSHVLAFSVDSSGATWTYNPVPVLDVVVFDDKEQAGNNSTRGGHLARFDSAPLSNPYTFAPGRALLTAEGPERSQAAAPVPVWPELSSLEVARKLSTYLLGATDNLFASAAHAAEVTARLRSVEGLLQRGAFQGARGEAGALRAFALTAVKNRSTRADLHDLFGKLGTCIQQQLDNRAPVAVAPDLVVRSVDGVQARVELYGQNSTDADSTPGTNDNIRYYRWLDEAGRVVGDAPTGVLKLPGDLGVPAAPIYRLTLEVEDAYGATGRIGFTVTLLPASRP